MRWEIVNKHKAGNTYSHLDYRIINYHCDTGLLVTLLNTLLLSKAAGISSPVGNFAENVSDPKRRAPSSSRLACTEGGLSPATCPPFSLDRSPPWTNSQLPPSLHWYIYYRSCKCEESLVLECHQFKTHIQVFKSNLHCPMLVAYTSLIEMGGILSY